MRRDNFLKVGLFALAGGLLLSKELFKGIDPFMPAFKGRDPFTPMDSIVPLLDRLLKDEELKSKGIRTKEIEDAFKGRFKLESDLPEKFSRDPTSKDYKKKDLTYKEFTDILGLESKIKDAPGFYKENKEHLETAERLYGVDARYITSILGIELSYGKGKAPYRAFNALASAYIMVPRRRGMFYDEIKKLFEYAKMQNKSVLDYENASHVGATGKGQFMPSSLLAYFVGKSGKVEDGNPDDLIDTIYSIANYLDKNGWKQIRRDELVTTDSHNWKVICTYNDDEKSFYPTANLELVARANWASAGRIVSGD